MLLRTLFHDTPVTMSRWRVMALTVFKITVRDNNLIKNIKSGLRAFSNNSEMVLRGLTLL